MEAIDLSKMVVGGELSPEKPTPIQSGEVVKVDILNISNHAYHKIPGVSSSTLKNCDTPLAYWKYINGEKKYNKQALTTGTLAHALFLEPENVEIELYDEEKLLAEVQQLRQDVAPENLKRVKEWKKAISKYLDADGELRENVLPKAVFQSLWALEKKLRTNPITEIMQGGAVEVSYIVTYANGLVAKIRPDLVKTANDRDAELLSEIGIKKGDLLIISVKTTIDGSPSGFRREAYKLKYHLAEAFYQDVMQAVDPDRKIHTLYVAIEKDAKNVFTGNAMMYCYDKKYFDDGRREYADALNVYNYCRETRQYEVGYEFHNNNNRIMYIE